MKVLQMMAALTLSGAGFYGSTAFLTPWSQAAFWGGVYLGFAVLTIRPRKVILRFGSLTWTQNEVCRHFLITGDTGSGKTTCGIQPLLWRLTRNAPEWGGLVFGVKGDEHEFVERLANAFGRSNDVLGLQLRPSGASTHWKPPHRFNLLSDRSLPWTTHAKTIVDIAASLTEGAQSAFFRPMAQISLAHSFQLLDELQEKVTITRALRLLTSTSALRSALEDLAEMPTTETHEHLLEFFKTTFVEAKAYEQREGIEGTIKTYLGFFMDPDIATVFSSDEPNSFTLSSVDDGAIITLTMPQRFVTERRYIQTYFKILFYYHALRRFEKTPQERTNENLLLLVADEFQDIVTATEDGISDHKIADRVRAANLTIIAAVQSEMSLDPAVGRERRKVLSLNMRSRLIFRAADSDGATASAEFIGKRSVWKRSRTSRALGPITHGRREEEEYRIKPSKLLRLPDLHAVVVHPSKRWQRLKPKRTARR